MEQKQQQQKAFFSVLKVENVFFLGVLGRNFLALETVGKHASYLGYEKPRRHLWICRKLEEIRNTTA